MNDLTLTETIKTYDELLTELNISEEQVEEILNLGNRTEEYELLELLYNVDKAYSFSVFSMNNGINESSGFIEFTGIEDMKSRFFHFLNSLDDRVKENIRNDEYEVTTLESEMLGIRDESILDLKKLFQKWKEEGAL